MDKQKKYNRIKRKKLVMDCCRDHNKTQKDIVDTDYSPVCYLSRR